MFNCCIMSTLELLYTWAGWFLMASISSVGSRTPVHT